MWFRGVPNALIVDSRITAVKAGLRVGTDELEAHYLAGGNVTQVVLSLIAAAKAGIELDFNRACAIDLAVKGTSKTVIEAVRTSINPKVIDCPGADMGKGGKIDAVARDGISLRVRARVTVRTNLDRFIGGATEETVVARVGEGIVTCIGSAASYKDVLENPDSISKVVLQKGVDVGTAFEIISIDIADVDVGENIGAQLQAAQAETDKKIAQPTQKSAVPPPSLSSRKWLPAPRKCAPRWSRPSPRSPWPSQKPSARATSASWTTRSIATSSPIRKCARASPVRPRPRARRSNRHRPAARGAFTGSAGGPALPACFQFALFVPTPKTLSVS